MYMREAFRIRRFHTITHVAMEETVGQHTANLINMLIFLYDELPPKVLLRALYHDAPELITGDLPAPAKWLSKELSAAIDVMEARVQRDMELFNEPMSEFDEAMLKYADMMDLCFKAVEEISVGNQLFFPLLMRGLIYIRALLQGPLVKSESAAALFKALEDNPHVYIPEFWEDQPTGVKH
jgi:5'-deoxynucleotidase YfbR-like HD superfamily hydrolase